MVQDGKAVEREILRANREQITGELTVKCDEHELMANITFSGGKIAEIYLFHGTNLEEGDAAMRVMMETIGRATQAIDINWKVKPGVPRIELKAAQNSGTSPALGRGAGSSEAPAAAATAQTPTAQTPTAPVAAPVRQATSAERARAEEAWKAVRMVMAAQVGPAAIVVMKRASESSGLESGSIYIEDLERYVSELIKISKVSPEMRPGLVGAVKNAWRS